MNREGSVTVSPRTRVAAWCVAMVLLALPGTLALPDDPPADDSKPKEDTRQDSTQDSKAPAQPAPVPRTSPPPSTPAPKAPARKPSGTARSEARPAVTPAPGEAAAKPAEPPLRFTDEDLERYRPPVRADEEVVDETGPSGSFPAPGPAPAAQSARPAAAGPVAPSGATSRPGPGAPPSGKPGPGAPPSVRPGAPPAAAGQVKTSGPVTLGPSPQVKRPPKKKPAPPPDPLAPFKQREAHEKFRAEQIEGLRGKIAELESRLEYLKAKRISITDPLNLMPRAQSEDDRQADASLRPEALLLQVETEIASTERQLDDTRTALAAIQMRFGAEAGIR